MLRCRVCSFKFSPATHQLVHRPIATPQTSQLPSHPPFHSSLALPSLAFPLLLVPLFRLSSQVHEGMMTDGARMIR